MVNVLSSFMICHRVCRCNTLNSKRSCLSFNRYHFRFIVIFLFRFLFLWRHFLSSCSSLHSHSCFNYCCLRINMYHLLNNLIDLGYAVFGFHGTQIIKRLLAFYQLKSSCMMPNIFQPPRPKMI
jgi:hypothetical protein